MVARLKEKEELVIVGKTKHKRNGNHSRPVRGRLKESLGKTKVVNRKNITETSRNKRTKDRLLNQTRRT